jgi:replicative DNA helicase
MEKAVLWVALEMSEPEVLRRFCKMLDPKAHPDALDYLGTMKIISGSKTVAQVESEAMRNKYDLVVLDYLQLCRCERRFDTDVQELQEITRRMKLLAMNQGLIVLAAAQLNRDVEQQTRTPRLSDLRGSGSIEQDSDTVILIHRALRPDDQKPAFKTKRFGDGEDHLASGPAAAETARRLEGRGDTSVFVEKNRNGRTGQVDMKFKDDRLIFVDPSPPPAWIK